MTQATAVPPAELQELLIQCFITALPQPTPPHTFTVIELVTIVVEPLVVVLAVVHESLQKSRHNKLLQEVIYNVCCCMLATIICMKPCIDAWDCCMKSGICWCCWYAARCAALCIFLISSCIRRRAVRQEVAEHMLSPSELSSLESAFSSSCSLGR